MADLRRYFEPVAAQPTAAETGIGEGATTAANKAVQQVIEGGAKSGGRGQKRKAYTTFTDKQRAKIDKYVAKNSNSVSLKQFGKEIDVKESTVRFFKCKYIKALKVAPNAEVKCIPAKKRGRPLTLGELDAEVRMFVQALRKGGTSVNTAVNLAAAEEL